MEIKQYTAEDEKAKVGLFIGHSIQDGGAESPRTGLSETDYNTPVAHALATHLSNHNISATVYSRVTREEFSDMLEDERSEEFDLVLSMHLNCYHRKTEGTEVLYCAVSKKGKMLAHGMLNPIITLFGGKNRGIKELDKGDRAWFIVWKTRAPTVIVEAKFIDNVNDERRLRQYQDLYDEALFFGILKYLRAVGKIKD